MGLYTTKLGGIPMELDSKKPFDGLHKADRCTMFFKEERPMTLKAVGMGLNQWRGDHQRPYRVLMSFHNVPGFGTGQLAGGQTTITLSSGRTL
eukprot:11851001-Ditylum_brightwellii.AAC.1